MPSEPATPAPAPVPTVPLDEWCRDISRTDKRVELIAGFHHTERAAGRVGDTAAAFASRYAAFATAPAA